MKVIDKKHAYSMNGSVLAYIGDAIYEVAIREMMVGKYPHDAGKAHRKALDFVSADGQAHAAKKMCETEFLAEDEEKVLKRARNHRATSRPKNADPKNYKWATGFEALIGYLYLSGETDRLEAVLDEAIRLIKKEKKQRENVARKAAREARILASMENAEETRGECVMLSAECAEEKQGAENE